MRDLIVSCKCSATDQAMESPSKVAVPRPISSRITSEFSVALLMMSEVSFISTMKVDWPEVRSSEAPTRQKIRSTRPMRAFSAGT